MMAVEMIGWIAPRVSSELIPPVGPPLNTDVIAKTASIHEEAGFDRVLIGYFSNAPDGFLIGAHAATVSGRLEFLLAHRPGFMTPTVAARKLATLDQLTGGRTAVHLIAGGNNADQARDEDFTDHDTRYRRIREYVTLLQRTWTEPLPFDHEGEFYRVVGAYADIRCQQEPHIPIYGGGGSRAAIEALAPSVDVYMLWGEPLQATAAFMEEVRAVAVRTNHRPPCVHTPQWVQAAANIHSPEKRAPMLCSPAYASSLYPCDLTDAEWAQLSPLLPSPPRRGRPRCWSLRLLVNALFYILRTGCAWRYLPREYPPWQTAYTTFRQWRLHEVWQRVHEALRRAVRVRVGRDPEPSTAIMDSQSVKTTEESGLIKGYDGGKQVKGRKRHVLGDTLGLLLAVYVTPANTSDQEGVRRLLVGLKPLQPRLELIWADSAYRGDALATWCATEGAWHVEIITCVPHVQGFVVRPWCWIVERTLGWMGRQRRLSKDYERKVQTSETLLQLAMIRLMVRRLARSPA